MSYFKKLSLIFLLLISLTGCYHGSIQQAKTVGQGQGQLAIETSAIIFPTLYPMPFFLPVPDGRISTSVGVTDSLDLRASLGTWDGLGGGFKLQLTPPMQKDLVVSIAPFASILPLEYDTAILHAELPILVDLYSCPNSSITLSGNALFSGAVTEKRTRTGEYRITLEEMMPGLSLGVGYATRSGNMTVMPAASVAVYLPGIITGKLGVSFMFGGR